MKVGHPECQPDNPEVRQHTPTPWRLCTKGNIGSAIEAQTGRKTHEWDDGYRIIATYQEGCSSGLYEDLEANRIANGLLIVEAVNNYATLQARVEELTKALEATREQLIKARDASPEIRNHELETNQVIAHAWHALNDTGVAMPLEQSGSGK